MDEQRNKYKTLIYILIIGILLWGFYFIQDEFAKYGMYQLISYRVHEISSVIPLLSILTTILCTGYLLWRWIKKKSDKTENVLLIAFVLCFWPSGRIFQNTSRYGIYSSNMYD